MNEDDRNKKSKIRQLVIGDEIQDQGSGWTYPRINKNPGKTVMGRKPDITGVHDRLG
jgi:hypothetical protein